jgi:hypothetical protein
MLRPEGYRGQSKGKAVQEISGMPQKLSLRQVIKSGISLGGKAALDTECRTNLPSSRS